MVKDAELHAADDKKRKELVDAKNNADSLIYQTEKSMKEVGESIDEETKSKVESAIEPLKKAIETDDVDTIKKLTEELTEAAHKVAEAAYQKSAQDGQAGAEGAPGAEGAAAPEADDDVVDADFEEVKEEAKEEKE